MPGRSTDPELQKQGEEMNGVLGGVEGRKSTVWTGMSMLGRLLRGGKEFPNWRNM